jgi:hypothetical protein
LTNSLAGIAPQKSVLELAIAAPFNHVLACRLGSQARY